MANQHRSERDNRSENVQQIETDGIDLKKVTPQLFNEEAKKAAKCIAANRKSNKPTQLRRFYDEIVMWDNKTAMHPDKFDEYLPFIRMLNAKAAYAKGRNELVDDNFLNLLAHCLQQVEEPADMHNCKYFIEAFMGFYKGERPRD